MATLIRALAYLRPGVGFSDRNGTLAGVVWPVGVTSPSQAQVDAASALLDCWDARRASYPPIGDGLDALVKKENGDATQWEAYVAACLAVKAEFPKPSEQGE